MWRKTLQATKSLKKKRKEAPPEVFECSATYCDATCTEDDGVGWSQCDYCDMWVCTKRGCKRFLAEHEESCDLRSDK